MTGSLTLSVGAGGVCSTFGASGRAVVQGHVDAYGARASVARGVFLPLGRVVAWSVHSGERDGSQPVRWIRHLHCDLRSHPSQPGALHRLHARFWGCAAVRRARPVRQILPPKGPGGEVTSRRSARRALAGQAWCSLPPRSDRGRAVVGVFSRSSHSARCRSCQCNDACRCCGCRRISCTCACEMTKMRPITK